MLKTRILSALVIAPPILFAGWFGEWPFTLFVAICGFLMAWEWMSLCRQRFGITGVVLGAILALVAVLAQGKPIWVAFMILIVALPLISALAQRTKVNPGWVSVGVLYLGVPLAAVVIVRGEGGWQTLFWLFVVVWSTDIGAYAFGRSIKGPKIAPSISPSKTWSGLLGGMLCAAAGSALFIMFTHVEYAATMQDVVIIASCLAVVAQAGDFLESAIKRRFNVKDSGKIIPGHGGVLDRVDGLMAAACVVAVIVLIREGGIASW